VACSAKQVRGDFNEKLRQLADSIYEFWGDCCGGLAIFFWVWTTILYIYGAKLHG